MSARQVVHPARSGGRRRPSGLASADHPRRTAETQLGYKSMKFLRRIVVADRFDDLGKLGPLQNGWSWYAGI